MRCIDADELEKEGWSLHRTIRVDKHTEEYQTKPLKRVPTIDPEPQWIPCSEGLPANDDFVVVTVLDESGDTPYRYSDFGWYFNVAKCWIIDAEQRTDVIAWMPLPEPYCQENFDMITGEA